MSFSTFSSHPCSIVWLLLYYIGVRQKLRHEEVNVAFPSGIVQPLESLYNCCIHLHTLSISPWSFQAFDQCSCKLYPWLVHCPPCEALPWLATRPLHISLRPPKKKHGIVVSLCDHLARFSSMLSTNHLRLAISMYSSLQQLIQHHEFWGKIGVTWPNKL